MSIPGIPGCLSPDCITALVILPCYTGAVTRILEKLDPVHLEYYVLVDQELRKMAAPAHADESVQHTVLHKMMHNLSYDSIGWAGCCQDEKMVNVERLCGEAAVTAHPLFELPAAGGHSQSRPVDDAVMPLFRVFPEF